MEGALTAMLAFHGIPREFVVSRGVFFSVPMALEEGQRGDFLVSLWICTGDRNGSLQRRHCSDVNAARGMWTQYCQRKVSERKEHERTAVTEDTRTVLSIEN